MVDYYILYNNHRNDLNFRRCAMNTRAAQAFTGEARLAIALIKAAIEEKDKTFIQSEMFDFWCGLMNADPTSTRYFALKQIKKVS